MGRTQWLWIGATLVIGAMPELAWAEIQDTTPSLGPGQWSLAGEFQANLEPTFPLTFNLHQNVGIVGGFDIFAREDIPISEPRNFYLGAGIKWTILHDKHNAPGVALWVGGHYYTGAMAGANVALLVSHHFSIAGPYGGLTYDLDFAGDLQHKLRLLLGVRIPIVNHFAWFVEAGLGLIGSPAPHFVATGPRFVI